jgi:hypothetical protein
MPTSGTRSRLARAIAIVALAGLAEPAAATTWTVDCSAGTISNGVTTVASGLTASNALGSLLGTPISAPLVSPPPVPGDTIQINSICTEDILVQIPGLTLTNDSGTPGTLDSGDGVEGQLEFAGTGNSVIDGIEIGDASGPFTFGGSEVANLYVHDGASVAVENSQVSNGPLIGILVTRSSEVSVTAAAVSSNGLANTGNTTNMGILASSNATVSLGKSDGSEPATIATNTGSGVVASDGSSLVIRAAAINGNATAAGGNGLAQVALLGASSGFITGMNASGTTIAAPSGGCCQAVSATGASTLDIEQGAVITGNQNNAAIALNSSTLLLEGAIVTSGLGASSPAKSEATIHGTGNSVIALAGGNIVCFGALGVATPCNITAGGYALGIDHVSTLIQVSGSVLGYANAADTVGGGGNVLLQSTADLGIGLVSAAPSVAWNVGSTGIAVSQNSSFRLQGGVNITGTGTLGLNQGSNGFFNTVNGGTNVIAGGIICGFVTVPAAHVAGPGKVSPTPTVAVNMQSVAPGQCLAF